MQLQLAEFKNKGMFQDTSISKATNEFAYENWNIRITAVNDNTLFSVTNEKGPSTLSESLSGTYLGHCIVGNYIVIFTVGGRNNTISYIYRLRIEDTVEVFKLYEGNRLGLNINNPIETLGYYESEDIQKVYWVDGLNQPRVINIAVDTTYSDLSQFDFAPIVDSFPLIEVIKEFGGYGQFPSGTIQYFVSYYNKFGSETNIVAATDLFYINPSDRGAKADETVSCDFKITISNLDTSYDYIRVYSAKRSSLNGPIQLNIVSDINIKDTTSITIVDTNTNQEAIDPTIINYIGGAEIVAGTITQKNDTLFLGDLSLTENLIAPIRIIEASKAGTLKDYFSFNYGIVLDYPTPSGYWEYNNYLNLNSSKFKTFKYGEYYRFAIQFQNNKGIWTEPVYIGDDILCDLKPYILNGEIHLAKLSFNTLGFKSTYGRELKDFVNYRILMAETSIANRRVIAQGILCPTVFNLQQRIENTPYSIGSWIMRPDNGNAHFKHFDDVGSEADNTNDSQEIQGIVSRISPTTELIETSYSSKYSNLLFMLVLDEVKNTIYFVLYGFNTAILQPDMGIIFDYIITGNSRENVINKFNSFVTDELGYSNSFRFETSDSEWTRDGKAYRIDKTAESFIVKEKVNKESKFYIDRSKLTFNSPELENNYHQLNNVEGLKLRLVGVSEVSANYTDTLIETTTSGVAKYNKILESSSFNFPNITLRTKSLLNDYLYKDSIWQKNQNDKMEANETTALYKVYLWQRSGSLNGQPLNAVNTLGEEYSYITAELKHKIFANKRFSAFTHYFDTDYSYDIEPLKIFNSDELSIVSSKEGDKVINYYGNYDYLIAPSNNESDKYLPVIDSPTLVDYDDEAYRLSNSCRIKYKETPHALISFKAVNNRIPLLPYLSLNSRATEDYTLSSVYNGITDTDKYPWNTDNIKYSQSYIQNGSYNTTYLYIGELYRDTNEDLYGGKTDEALKKLTWIPCSKAYKLGEILKEVEGDTYFQRWDCLKSYPFTEEDENSIVDITSVLLESHINLDGRCDVNKENLNIKLARPTNYNLFNPAYNQSNNIFKYNILDNKYDLNKFSNQITWSLTKNPTEDIDTWTNISMANTLNLDGTYGKINKLINSNDAIIAFQDKAISVVNYNERVQISTEQGVPIELSNSGKVTGYTKVTDNNGCINKWSICKTPSGIYFNDDINKSLMRFNNKGISNISSLGMSQWFKNNLNSIVWKPGNEGFKLHYDNITHDVYITNRNNCLLFNEDLQTFTSFMEYNNINFIFNNNKGKSFTSLNTDSRVKLYNLFNGNYNTSFDNRPINYSITYKVNPEPYIDKTFTNIEYISDLLDNEKIDFNNKILKSPFDKLEVWNEYQHGESSLFSSTRPSSLKQKFRTWRVEIPRDDNSTYKLDRMRNPWLMLKLSKNDEDINKMVFHNLLVKYYK